MGYGSLQEFGELRCKKVNISGSHLNRVGTTGDFERAW